MRFFRESLENNILCFTYNVCNNMGSWNFSILCALYTEHWTVYTIHTCTVCCAPNSIHTCTCRYTCTYLRVYNVHCTYCTIYIAVQYSYNMKHWGYVERPDEKGVSQTQFTSKQWTSYIQSEKQWHMSIVLGHKSRNILHRNIRHSIAFYTNITLLREFTIWWGKSGRCHSRWHRPSRPLRAYSLLL